MSWQKMWWSSVVVWYCGGHVAPGGWLGRGAKEDQVFNLPCAKRVQPPLNGCRALALQRAEPTCFDDIGSAQQCVRVCARACVRVCVRARVRLLARGCHELGCLRALAVTRRSPREHTDCTRRLPRKHTRPRCSCAFVLLRCSSVVGAEKTHRWRVYNGVCNGTIRRSSEM